MANKINMKSFFIFFVVFFLAAWANAAEGEIEKRQTELRTIDPVVTMEDGRRFIFRGMRSLRDDERRDRDEEVRGMRSMWNDRRTQERRRRLRDEREEGGLREDSTRELRALREDRRREDERRRLDDDDDRDRRTRRREERRTDRDDDRDRRYDDRTREERREDRERRERRRLDDDRRRRD